MNERVCSGYLLVVDDDEDVRGSIEDALALDGYVIVAVENGEQAIGSLAVAKPRLVVTDLEMPVRDGLALIAKIRGDRRTAELPICVVSGETQTDGFPDGVVVVKKPFKLETLLETVRVAMTGHASRSGQR